ncbi:MAG: DUF87 domain-containing protein [Chloroflexi bacterium]|nr:DUF87 domain-containing protein [Chloroflexota bacterium]MCC6895684.1 DUF87 domain-containing protein [Anaerolineae bacterium]
MTSNIYNTFEDDQRYKAEIAARECFSELIQKNQYVGDVYSIGYESSLVLIHDHYRKQVGGVPSLSFLIATRINPDVPTDYKLEDASILLLRVMDAASLPNASEAERIRVETAQRVSGETDSHWDDAGSMDPTTHNLLSFAGVKCRVIGTFFLDQVPDSDDESALELRFGSDLSNYYPNRGLKVYKPSSRALWRIVNYRDPERSRNAITHPVNVGNIRYASTNRSFQGIADVPVNIMPDDLIAQKTALFGMTRTGKSNTTKVMLQAVFNLRIQEENPFRVGQIVFDPNGEYANENVQDQNNQQIATAIKNIGANQGIPEDVVTYGITSHPQDTGRKLMLLNFFEDDNLQIGKEIVDAALSEETAIYVRNFKQVSFDRPASTDRRAITRFNRRVLVYRTILFAAGFKPSDKMNPQTKGLFKKELLDAMQQHDETEYQSAGRILANLTPTWGQLVNALKSLEKFMKDKAYKDFDTAYVNNPDGSGDPWADEGLQKLLGLFEYSNGVKLIGKVHQQHTASTSSDYALEIYNDLFAGRLVIIDQSSGDPEINKASAERIMWYIFHQNQQRFREGNEPPKIIIYIEEAHNLLPAGNDMDLKDVWVRTAKEGAKYQLGMVYATQEVSSIQRNILKNTSNWFIGHLNNTDETRELCKYYDFADFEASIRRAQDKGFLRVKTMSNLFVVPVQVKKFEV